MVSLDYIIAFVTTVWVLACLRGIKEKFQRHNLDFDDVPRQVIIETAYMLLSKPKAGASPGLILRYCKILQKKIEHRNDAICRKIIDSARSKKVQFWLQ